MDLILGYKSEDEKKELEATDGGPRKLTLGLNPSEIDPALHSTHLKESYELIKVEDFSGSRHLSSNVPHEIMIRPEQTAQYPLRPTQNQTNSALGQYEIGNMSEIAFEEQRKGYQIQGYAVDPSYQSTHAGHYVFNAERLSELENRKTPEKRRRLDRGSPSDSSFLGPWAKYEDEIIEAPSAPTLDEINEIRRQEAEKKKVTEFAVGNETTIFHGSSERDYLGRTYIHVPNDVDVDLTTDAIPECFIPKKLVHTWTGHNAGISAIRFFPKSGHLLLSCSMDNKIKIWDVYHERRCLRTFLGHSKAVRDICFSNDGGRFLSCGYDKYVKMWDTETGKCVGTYTNGKIPYCVKFNPNEDKQHIFLAGCSDKKIIQWDTNTGEITQEYNEHLGSVNTITFIDENRRFVSTSDDKTIRVWDFDIPVQIKYIADPQMHSLPSIASHPSGKYFIGQSLDNQILTYTAGDRVRLNPKKRFAGHLIAGFACQVNFSPDGRFVMSGDSVGRLWFWDWKTNRVIKTFKAHNEVCIGAEWHPRETSKVATCSWDGTIKFWD